MRSCIIDDEHISRTIIDATLKRQDSYTVEAFPSASRAITRCKEITFDLIFVDYQMPEMNGIECISHIPPSLLASPQMRFPKIGNDVSMQEWTSLSQNPSHEIKFHRFWSSTFQQHP